MNRDCFLETSPDCLQIGKDQCDGKVVYYSVESDSAFYGSIQIAELLNLCKCGVTYGKLEEYAGRKFSLQPEETRYLVENLLQVGLLRTFPQKTVASIPKGRIENGVSLKHVPTAYLHLTYECNLNCKYCYNSNIRDASQSDNLSISEWKSILDDLRSNNVHNIIVTGGEPFIRKDIIELLAEWRGDEDSIEVITNGTLITYSDIELIKNAFNAVTISLDSDKNDACNEIRGKGVYSRVIETIELLKDNNISWKVNSTLTELNISKFPEIEKGFIELGAVNVSPIVLNPNISCMDLMPSLFQIEHYYDTKYDKVREEIKNSGLMESPGIWYSCGAGIREFAIDPHGDLFPCRLLLDDEWNCGSLLHEGFQSIWHSSQILLSLRSYLTNRQAYCSQDCLIRKHCNGGCLAESNGLPPEYSVSCNNNLHCAMQKLVIPQHIEMKCLLEDVNKKGET